MLKTRVISRLLQVGQWKTRMIGEEANKPHMGKGWKPSRVCLVGLRNRDYPLMEISNDEFATRLARDGQGFFIETPYVTRGIPIVWTRQGYLICIWPIPVHQWRMKVTIYKEVEDEPASTVRGRKADDSDTGAGNDVEPSGLPATVTLQRDEYREHPQGSGGSFRFLPDPAE